MRITTIVFVAALSLLLGSIFLASTKPMSAIADSSAPPSGKTGAPGEGTCVTCHTGTSGAGLMTMNLAHSPTFYVPGQTDTLVLLLSDQGSVRKGFEVTALKNDQSMAGTFTTLLAPQTGLATSGGKTYVGHRSNGAIAPFDPYDGTFWGLPGGVLWAVEWTAPPAGAGPVTFYAAGVLANGDEMSGNTDTTYTYTLTILEQATSPVTGTTWGKIKKQYR